jgi:hypothetical protein
MQSEKSALSRAIQQNKELKDQLNVLEEAYIKLTNTNADLLNQVQAEKHMNKQLNTAISLKDNELNLLKTTDNNNKVENAIQLIENTKIDDNLEQDWEEIEDVNEFKKDESLNNISSSNSEEERNREVERISNSYNELINTLTDKDLLINQLNNELNELKDKVNSINFDKETLTALVTKNEELKFKEEVGLLIILIKSIFNSSILKIKTLNSKLIQLELERNKLIEINEKLNSINKEEEKVADGDEDNPIYTQKNIKLLEVTTNFPIYSKTNLFIL